MVVAMWMGSSLSAAYMGPVMADAIVMKAVRTSLNKPEGKLTGADLNKVTTLDLSYTQISDASLKELGKLR